MATHQHNQPYSSFTVIPKIGSDPARLLAGHELQRPMGAEVQHGIRLQHKAPMRSHTGSPDVCEAQKWALLLQTVHMQMSPSMQQTQQADIAHGTEQT